MLAQRKNRENRIKMKKIENRGCAKSLRGLRAIKSETRNVSAALTRISSLTLGNPTSSYTLVCF